MIWGHRVTGRFQFRIQSLSLSLSLSTSRLHSSFSIPLGFLENQVCSERNFSLWMTVIIFFKLFSWHPDFFWCLVSTVVHFHHLLKAGILARIMWKNWKVAKMRHVAQEKNENIYLLYVFCEIISVELLKS